MPISVSYKSKWCFARLHWFAITLLGISSASSYADELQKPWESEPEPYVIEDRLRLQVSFWNADINTSVRVDKTTTTTQAGTTLSGERDLGLKRDKLMPDFELTLFPGERHIISLSSFSSRRTGEVTLDSTVNFGKDLFNTGDVVNSTLDLNMVGLGYGYRILKDRRYELDGYLRVQVATFTDNLQCALCAPRPANEPLPNYNRTPDTITLPLPMVGVGGRFQIYKGLDFTGRYQWLGATVVDTNGVIREWQAGLLYHCNQHFGIGLDYRGYNIHVDSQSTDHPGVLDLRYAGWQLGFRATL